MVSPSWWQGTSEPVRLRPLPQPVRGLDGDVRISSTVDEVSLRSLKMATIFANT